MITIKTILAVTAALVAVPATAGGTPVPSARISMTQARTIALKAAPGRVQDAEYEKEGGGWRYSFDIRQGKRIHEIGVDANTGRIVEDAYEKPGDKD